MAITRTPMVDDDGTGTTGTVINNAWKQQFYDQIDATVAASAIGPFVAYAGIVWTASPTPPVLGNGSLTARYLRLGNLVLMQLYLTWGSTTTGGSGGWLFSIPLASTGIAMPLGGGMALRGGGAGSGYGAFLANPNQINPFSGAPGAAGVGMSATTPFTWASGDWLRLWAIYETS